MAGGAQGGVGLVSPIPLLSQPLASDEAKSRTKRKEQISHAQLEELMAADPVKRKKRRALLRLQESLGLDGDTANRLEREVIGAHGGEA